jgi:hypothetical protein
MPRGSVHGSAKITEEMVVEIRARRHRDPSITHQTLAEEFGISQGAVSMLLSGRTWGHVPMPEGPRGTVDRAHRPRRARDYPPELFSPHADRFWSTVDRSSADGCWPWTAKLTNGRGMFYIDPSHRDYVASRVAYALDRGADPGHGMEVCHDCDNPACCRPDHLFLGTPKQNSEDRIAKGRGTVRLGEPKPERQPMKYKPIDVDVVELFADRFHEKHLIGHPSECWEWIRGHRRPVFMLPVPGGGQDPYQAERIAWALHNNRDPGPLVVRHTCDNDRCVNPHHLILGTHQQNHDDRMERSGPARCKLTEDQVREIRRRYAIGEATQRTLAAEFQISGRQVFDLVHRKSWRHID